MSNLLLPSLQRNFTAALAWNLALDATGEPRLPTAYCDNCKGAITVLPGTGPQAGVRASLQLTLLSHFALASPDLTRLGGGQAVNSPLVFSARVQHCLTGAGFLAPTSSARKRYGLVVQNTCNTSSSTVTVGIQAARKAQKVALPVGVSTLVWSI